MELYTTLQLAKIFQVHPDTIRRYVKEGMPTYKLGQRNFRFRVEECLIWIQERTPGVPGRKPNTQPDEDFNE